MAGVQLTMDPTAAVAKLREAGLLCPGSGTNTIRILPPLTASAAEIDEAAGILREVIGKL